MGGQSKKRGERKQRMAMQDFPRQQYLGKQCLTQDMITPDTKKSYPKPLINEDVTELLRLSQLLMQPQHTFRSKPSVFNPLLLLILLGQIVPAHATHAKYTTTQGSSSTNELEPASCPYSSEPVNAYLFDQPIKIYKQLPHHVDFSETAWSGLFHLLLDPVVSNDVIRVYINYVSSLNSKDLPTFMNRLDYFFSSQNSQSVGGLKKIAFYHPLLMRFKELVQTHTGNFSKLLPGLYQELLPHIYQGLFKEKHMQAHLFNPSKKLHTRSTDEKITENIPHLRSLLSDPVWLSIIQGEYLEDEKIISALIKQTTIPISRPLLTYALNCKRNSPTLFQNIIMGSDLQNILINCVKVGDFEFASLIINMNEEIGDVLTESDALTLLETINLIYFQSFQQHEQSWINSFGIFSVKLVKTLPIVTATSILIFIELYIMCLFISGPSKTKSQNIYDKILDKINRKLTEHHEAFDYIREKLEERFPNIQCPIKRELPFPYPLTFSDAQTYSADKVYIDFINTHKRGATNIKLLHDKNSRCDYRLNHNLMSYLVLHAREIVRNDSTLTEAAQQHYMALLDTLTQEEKLLPTIEACFQDPNTDEKITIPCITKDGRSHQFDPKKHTKKDANTFGTEDGTVLYLNRALRELPDCSPTEQHTVTVHRPKS